MENDFYFIAVSRHRLVNGVIHNLVNKVM
jgi:hypothetical protein